MGLTSSVTSERRSALQGLCLITDRKTSGMAAEEAVTLALEAGVQWVQYREKDKTRGEIYAEALKLRNVTRHFGALFVVNDHADIALAVDADGVHLGQDDLPLRDARKIMGEKIVGVSTHSPQEAADAGAGGADYIGFGPVFPTVTKKAGVPKGVEMLRQVKRQVAIPVVAIGGISVENLAAALEAGADAVAVAGAILRGNISENVRSFMHVLGRERYGRGT